ncbi:hypothetical protein E4U42_005007 [Claviceps africana]|uniref:Erythromycin esterase n=1 Tax=Claviceps africana TaxID=83212 RepID=A0A8K0J497_9HYPO|nr:hypothetical protein E4U42_005007 [Claviceps africana]
MSPPRRRSARLASASAVKNRATPDLASVAEVDETPSRRTTSRVHADTSVPSPVPELPTTPVSSGLKPPSSEMHPSRFHTSTGAPSSALRLGFTDIPKQGRAPNGQDSTPSKIRGVPNGNFTFRVSREGADAGLSTGAQRMLDEIRDQAAKIKADLVAQREAEGGPATGERQFARPKGRVGRFSAAHMAEFKKMDSIEGHASAWRAQDGRFTPVKALKRTPSKANLDATPTSQRTDRILRCVGKADQEESPNARPRPNLKRKSSAAGLDGDRDREVAVKRHNANPTPGKFSTASRAEPSTSGAKRVKQQQDDDAATTRPQSPVVSPSKRSSVFSRLATPKKVPAGHSLAYTRSSNKPTLSLGQSSSKTSLNSPFKFASASGLNSMASKAAEMKRRIISPRSLRKVKALQRGAANSPEHGTSAIPAPRASQTPAASRVNKELPPAPLTTPRRKLTKHVTFTPNVVTTVNAQNSPSPQRTSNLKLRSALRTIETHYAPLDDVLARSSVSHSLYPDLSPLKRLIDESEARRVVSASPCRPDAFTFRSDHTLKFSDPFLPEFGASPGQFSVRHVSSPAGSKNIPGSFPAPPSPSSHPDKENNDPAPIKLLSGTAHGMQNKKRHRASVDEDDFDTARAAKKRKDDNVPEGQELLAPRLVRSGLGSATKAKTNGLTRTPRKTPITRTPGRNAARTPATTSPTKKAGGLSISRLNMLARPKNRA